MASSFWSHPATWLHTRPLSEATFRPTGATKGWETNSVSRLVHLLAHLDLLSTDFFSCLTALTTVAASAHKSKIWLLKLLRLSHAFLYIYIFTRLKSISQCLLDRSLFTLWHEILTSCFVAVAYFIVSHVLLEQNQSILLLHAKHQKTHNKILHTIFNHITWNMYIELQHN